MAGKKKREKTRYRVTNWAEYNAALIGRGRVSVWVDEAVPGWLNRQKTGKRGASNTYSDLAVQCMGTLRVLFGLPLRATQGFTSDLFGLMGLSLPVISYTQLSRRLKTLEVPLPKRKDKASSEPLHVVMDSTGLKVFGEGEWKVRQHGWCRRRTWRKLHLGIDAETGEIACAMFTHNDCHDSEVVGEMLDQVEEPIGQFSADGAYDTRTVYNELGQRKVPKVAIPPQKNARIWQHGNSKKPPLARDENLREIRKTSRRQWKKSSDYHQRSKAETAMYRFKTLFGERLAGRTFEAQATDVMIGCRIMNIFTHLGMPTSVPITK